MQRVQYEFGEYVGEFDAETQRRHGHGRMTWTSSKNSYEGHWNQGHMHGEGTKKYANGDIYSGTWDTGKRHGHGVYRYNSGHEFNGEYRNDQCEGFGVLTLAHDAGSYEGEWLGGQKHGRGIERGRLKVRYEGQFQAGARHGFGVLVDENAEELLQSEHLIAEKADDDADGGASCAQDGKEKKKNDDHDDDDDDTALDILRKTKFGSNPSRFDTQWHQGTQIAGPRLEEQAAARIRQRQQQMHRGPIADAAMLEALTQAGVSPEAVQALGAFSTGVERSFGALGNGVAGMEGHIGQLVGTLDSLLGEIGEEEDEEDQGNNGDDLDADMEYAVDRKK